MRLIWEQYIDLPPVWLVAFLLGVWLQVSIWNPLAYTSPAATWLGWGLILGGIVLAVVSFRMFLRHKTSIIPRRTPDAMIASGPYRVSRNPIYLADALVLLGLVILQGSALSLALVPVFAWVIYSRFIRGEEQRLNAEFGDVYARYCARTRRWI